MDSIPSVPNSLSQRFKLSKDRFLIFNRDLMSFTLLSDILLLRRFAFFNCKSVSTVGNNMENPEFFSSLFSKANSCKNPHCTQIFIRGSTPRFVSLFPLKSKLIKLRLNAMLPIELCKFLSVSFEFVIAK